MLEKYVKVNDNQEVVFLNNRYGNLTQEQKVEFAGGVVTTSDIPEFQTQIGKSEILKFDINTDSFYYEYITRELTDGERIKQLEETMAMLMIGGGV